MIAKHVGNGRGIEDLVRYIGHDSPSDDERRPETADRVAWISAFNSPTDDIALTTRIMQGVVADASILKRLAGVSSRGRKLADPYAHLVLAWKPGDRPSAEEQEAAVTAALKSVGLVERLAVAVGHNDTKHYHIHIAACRVHPYDGRAADMGRSKLRLQEFAEQWERDHGGIQIQRRVDRRKARHAFAMELAREMARFKPTGRTVRERQRQRAEARKRAVARVRATLAHRLPPLKPPRPAGRLQGRRRRAWNPAERRRWSELYARQARSDADPSTKRAERAKLAAELEDDRQRAAARQRQQQQQRQTQTRNR